MKIFGREPALVLGLLSAGLQLVTALFLPLTTEQVAAINSIAAAGLGVWTAFATRNLDGGRASRRRRWASRRRASRWGWCSGCR
ncbi:hypothetical protein ACFQQB_01380 [Nonomuraea rubra]|uniref:hypothetical protein n=1 Tax=Nonomuraea rubra TaxID=46180 RepID=UPI003611E2FB